MRKYTLFGLAVTAALLGTALDQPVYAQANAGTSAGAGASAGVNTPAGNARTQLNAGVNANAGTAGTCPGGAPMPPNGTCPPARTRTTQPGANANTAVNGGANANVSGGAAPSTSTTSRTRNATTSAAGNAAAGANAGMNAARPGAPAGNPPGVGAPPPNVNITVQQRTQIGDAIRALRVRPAAPDFPVRIGVVVPHRAVLRPLPPPLLRIVPYYRGYLFFVLADGRIAIVQPRTLRIVAII